MRRPRRRTTDPVAVSSHPTGLPAGDGARTCGSCAWHDAALGCRFAAPPDGSPIAVPATTAACTHHEPPPDCLTCGACCREAFDAVPVEDGDAARLPDPSWFVTEDDGWRSMRRVPSPTGCGTRCAALRGDGAATPFTCVVYADRPDTCRDLAIGSEGCLQARRRVGLTPWGPGWTPDGPWARR